MTDKDRQFFATRLAILGEAFNEPVSDLRAEAYFEALNDLDIAAVARACKLSTKTHKFFPKPVELRDFIQGSDADHVSMAWRDILREVKRGDVTLSEATKEAVCMVWGSFRDLRETLPNGGPELLGWMKRFEAAYISVIRANDYANMEIAEEAERLASMEGRGLLNAN